MARRYDHTKEDLKELIIDSAEKIISRSGYQTLSTRKLAQKIGYSPGTIYSYFDSLDELILHLNANSLKKLENQIKIVEEQVKCPEEQLFEIAKIYQNFAINDYYQWDLLFNHQYKKSNALPEWYQTLIDNVFALVQSPISQFNCNKKNIHDFSHIYWAGIHGIIDLSSKSKLERTKAKSEKELIKGFIKIFIAGIKISNS
jgi:AcrR family transcriptional regulator